MLRCFAIQIFLAELWSFVTCQFNIWFHIVVSLDFFSYYKFFFSSVLGGLKGLRVGGAVGLGLSLLYCLSTSPRIWSNY